MRVIFGTLSRCVQTFNFYSFEKRKKKSTTGQYYLIDHHLTGTFSGFSWLSSLTGASNTLLGLYDGYGSSTS